MNRPRIVRGAELGRALEQEIVALSDHPIFRFQLHADVDARLTRWRQRDVRAGSNFPGMPLFERHREGASTRTAGGARRNVRRDDEVEPVDVTGVWTTMIGRL